MRGCNCGTTHGHAHAPGCAGFAVEYHLLQADNAVLREEFNRLRVENARLREALSVVVAEGDAVVLDAQPERVRATAATAPTTANERTERFICFSPSVWLCFIARCPVIWSALHEA